MLSPYMIFKSPQKGSTEECCLLFLTDKWVTVEKVKWLIHSHPFMYLGLMNINENEAPEGIHRLDFFLILIIKNINLKN